MLIYLSRQWCQNPSGLTFYLILEAVVKNVQVQITGVDQGFVFCKIKSWFFYGIIHKTGSKEIDSNIFQW